MSYGTNDGVILTVLKVVALVLAMLGTIGFGICGLWGVTAAIGTLFAAPGMGLLIIVVPSAIGLLIAFGCLLATRRLLRSLGRDRS
jgi:hypothetical protein